jgi:hypothetical protein
MQEWHRGTVPMFHGDPLKVITKYGLINSPYLRDDPWPTTGHHTTKKILNSLESKLSDEFRIFFCW